MASDRFNVSYTLRSKIVDRIDARAQKRGWTRSRQVEADLTAYYSLMERGMRDVLHGFSVADLRVIVQALHKKIAPVDPIASGELMHHVQEGAAGLVGTDDAETLAKRVDTLHDVSKLALVDWVQEN